MTTQEERAARLKAAASKSLKLMQMDASGKLDAIAESKRGDINSSIESTPVMGGQPQEMPNNATRNFNYNRVSPAAANVPSIIRESFNSQPPQQETNASVLDDVFGDVLQQQETISKAPKQRVVEQQMTSYPSQVDYPMIRTIVEEVVRKYTSSLGKKMLSENKNSEINTISLGKTFKFLTNSGDIYECTMRKVSNINEMKKKVQ